MENEAKQSMDLLQIAAWAHANRKQITSVLVAVLVIGGAIGIYIWHKNSVETAANEALSNIKFASPQGTAAPGDVEAYVKVATEYSGTSAGARALLIAGGSYFDAGKFDLARTQFEKFLQQYPENQLANQAALGVAACFEAQGKYPEATARYEDLAKRRTADSVGPQVKSALGRLYLAQNKPELALHYYEELAHANNNDTWSAEAGIQAAELLAKYPDLKKPMASAVPTVPPTPTTAATVKVPVQPNTKSAKP